MSRPKNVTLMACFLVLHGALLSTPGLGEDEMALVPDADDSVADGPTIEISSGPESILGFLDSCEKKISDECGQDIYDDIFGSEEIAPVSTSCCEELMEMGRECHDTIVDLVLRNVKDATQKEQFRKKSDETFRSCVSIIANGGLAKDDESNLPKF
ncbi:Prolamin-like domain [Dillenia turbinata]|uniref:Prolamin-like domain n=1 Tax=Dillenia turbinata TaxID=194707 RepID=A0AAN8VC99_9MAGN